MTKEKKLTNRTIKHNMGKAIFNEPVVFLCCCDEQLDDDDW